MVWYDGATALRSTFQRRSYAEHRKGEIPMGGDDMKATKQLAKASTGFTGEEKAAMRNRAQELKAEARANKNKAEGESAALAAIAALSASDRALAERVHAIITANAPELSPKTWYGMPAYANKDGQVVCHFQSAEKFKTRYATLGFSDQAHLDDGAMWPVAFALAEWTEAVEAKIAALVKKAVS
jgi:uncharacterized protein YdhG (YjbR/CyaY superfamily)